MLTVIYDSAAQRSDAWGRLCAIAHYSGLVRLLVARELTSRYKRSVIGLWWTLLNPLLNSLVMWVVFSNVFRFEIPGGVPFIIYLLTGVLVVNCFGQGLIVAANAVVGNGNVLTKVPVPPEVFATAAAAAQAVNFVIGLLPVFLLQLVLGVGIPVTALLLPVPVLLLTLSIAGMGLLIATVAIRFHDVLDLVAVAVTTLTYATPTFYPLSIVPADFQFFIKLNPAYWFVDVVRHLAYAGTIPTLRACVIVALFSFGAAFLGLHAFARNWGTLAARL